MARYTRKRGGGLFDMFSSKKNTKQQIANLEAQKLAAMRKSKSRVANIFTKPGEVTYTNKQRIDAEFGEKIKELLSQIEKPQETKAAVSSVVSSVENALLSESARKTGAVVITIPVGLAQLFVKAARVFLAMMFLIFVGLPAGVLGSNSAVSTAGLIAPNLQFNTTARAYNEAKKFTGVGRSGAVNKSSIPEFQ